MIALFKLHKIFLALVLVLFSLSAHAGMFGDMQASYHEQQGDHYFDQKRYDDAYAHYTSASKQNSGYAYFQLYAMNYNGEGRGKDLQLATRMLHKSAKLKYPTAEVILGNRYIYQKPKNINEGIRLLKSAANKEFVYAYADLYRIYSRGIGVRKDMTKAGQYYRLAKANGYDLKRSSSKKSYTSTSNKKLIRDIQSGLKQLGFYKSTVDGISGPMTRKSIADFQKFYGYPVNSKVSAQTLKQINGEL
ncbi:MAG: peptidoglycan-binding protein [Campylobacterota bacterium]|nr:peptidoglycan-binding protein [Campylobacterota bacterium]